MGFEEGGKRFSIIGGCSGVRREEAKESAGGGTKWSVGRTWEPLKSGDSSVWGRTSLSAFS